MVTNQFWFNTDIAGVTKSAIPKIIPMSVVKPKAKKPILSANKPRIASTTFWLIKPTRADEKTVLQAVAEITESTLSNNTTWQKAIFDKYSSQLSPEAFNDVLSLSSDLMAWSWKEEMMEAYKQKQLNPEMVGIVHDIFTDTKEMFNLTAWGDIWWVSWIWDKALKAAWIWAAAGWVAMVWNALEKVWDLVYWLWIPRDKSQIAKWFMWEKIKTIKDTAKQYNIMGTNTMIGKQSYKVMKKIAEKQINPARKVLDAWPKISYNIVKNNAIQLVQEDASLTILAKKNIIDDINWFFDKDIIPVEGKVTTYENLNKIKSSLDNTTSARTIAWKVPLWWGDAYKSYVAKASRKTIYDGFQSIWVDKNILQDYGNMKTIFTKAVWEWAKDPIGWILAMESEVLKTSLKPASTIWWRILWVSGKWLKEITLIPTLRRLWTKGIKYLKSFAKKALKTKWNLEWIAIEPALIQAISRSHNISEEEAKKMLDKSSEQFFQLPWETIKYLLDKIWGIEQTKNSKQYRKDLLK